MRPSSSNCSYALATDDWFGIVNIRIQRPRMRRAFTALKDCEPPLTCMTASVRPCVGRTAPMESGIQSIWFFITPVTAPCFSALSRHERLERVNLRGTEAAHIAGGRIEAGHHAPAQPDEQRDRLQGLRARKCGTRPRRTGRSTGGAG